MMRSRECRQCGEVHLLRSNGLMSIHQTAAGVRCEEPVSRAERQRAARRDDKKGGVTRRGRSGKSAGEQDGRLRLAQADWENLPEWQKDLERKAAFKAAAEGKRKGKSSRGSAGKSDRFDRKIYAVGGVRTVSGGSPGGGKRR